MEQTLTKQRLVIGISGASCAALGVLLLQEMTKFPNWETHLVITQGGRMTIAHETSYTVQDVEKMATVNYSAQALDAAIASGSFTTTGMVIVPCSMKSLAGIVSGYSDNLLLRAADVTLKERRPLVLATRESPLSTLHLHNMLRASELGAIIMPPMLTMYHTPTSIEHMLTACLARILRVFSLEMPGYRGWGE